MKKRKRRGGREERGGKGRGRTEKDDVWDVRSVCVWEVGHTHTHTLSPLSLPSLFALFLSLRATYHDEV